MATSCFREERQVSKLVSGNVDWGGRADLSMSWVRDVRSRGEGEGITPASELMVDSSASWASLSAFCICKMALLSTSANTYKAAFIITICISKNTTNVTNLKINIQKDVKHLYRHTKSLVISNYITNSLKSERCKSENN